MIKPYIVLLALIAVGCEEKREIESLVSDENITKEKITQNSSTVEVGIASYYADIFHGKPTASGEPYDRDALTAAHPTISFGDKVKVTELKGGRSIIVTINDRGPHTKSRVIDLSYAAAQAIGLVKAGITRVKVEAVSETNQSR